MTVAILSFRVVPVSVTRWRRGFWCFGPKAIWSCEMANLQEATKQGQSNTVLEPLLFPENLQMSALTKDVGEVSCILCESKFNLGVAISTLLRHLLLHHNLIIADVNLIADLKSYIEYWKGKAENHDLKTFCQKINAVDPSTGKPVTCFVLSDALSEDKRLRESLQKKYLEYVLECQQNERQDTDFSRGCLFCKKHFSGNRTIIFDHLANDHNFSVGQPDNIVFCKEYLDLLEEKLNSLQCLYCEKTFKDRLTLKEHMRKKLHKKINPKNTIYDKFYIINYLELGKNWESVQAEDDREIYTWDCDSDEEWEDWQEESPGAVCLFCSFSTPSIDSLYIHMNNEHNFNFKVLTKELQLGFYQQVKLVNYIRRQIFLHHCVSCDEQFSSSEELELHFTSTNHISKIPDSSIWDQPEYYFPTYENDNLLYALDGEEDDSRSGLESNLVFPEDSKVTESILNEESIRQELL